MTKPLRVGIIGATGGWAKDSHVPAVQRLTGLELVAVASSSQANADAAAESLGVKAAYGNGMDLIRDPDVDIVTVAVRVPDHHGLVLAALSAGKHVYCEWPLGRNVSEAEEMATAARTAGVHAAIGLQTRSNPAVLKAREVIRSGSLGRLLSARVYSTTAGFGPSVPSPFVYLEDPRNGANLVTIQGGHTLDLSTMLLGAFAEANALVNRQFPQIALNKEKSLTPRTTFDHILVQGTLGTGIPLSLEVSGGLPPDKTPFHFEISCEKGTLVLSGGAARGFQAGSLELLVNGQSQPVDASEVGAMPDSAINVAGLYAGLRDDILKGTRSAADFDHAVRLTHLIEDMFVSSSEGIRKTSQNWPI